MAQAALKDITRSKVWSHPARDLIIKLIKRGMSPPAIVREMIEQGYEPVTKDTIRSFKNSFLLTKGAEKSYWNTRFKEIDAVLDAVEEFAKVTKEQMKRIGEMREKEIDNEKFHPTLRHEMAIWKEMVKDFIFIKQQLGEVPMPTKQIISQKQMIMKSLDEKRQQILAEKTKTAEYKKVSQKK